MGHGSDQIGADYAWALWIFGTPDAARTRLDAILATHPANAEALDCAAIVALARGDSASFLADHRRRAEARGEPALVARDRFFAEAYQRGGGSGLLTALVVNELADQRDQAYPDHSGAAFYASLGGNRALLLHILGLASAGHERWGAAGFLRRERAIWAKDPVALRALERVTGDKVEQLGSSSTKR